MTTKRENERAAKIISRHMRADGVRVTDNYDGRWAIVVDEAGLDAIEVSYDADIAAEINQDGHTRSVFLEPINSGLLRLVRA